MSSLLIRRLNLRAAFTSSSRGQRACVGELFKGGTRPRFISKGMGNHHSATLTTHVLQVKTGDRKGAGTDANVTVILHDDHGKKSSPLKLDHPLRDDLERGSLDVFPVAEPLKEFGKIQKIEFTMEKFGLASDWYVESVCIEDKRQESIIPYMFPIHRWIRPSRCYVFDHLDCKLPQEDQEIDQRKEELTEKRRIYELEQKAPGLPAQVKQIPDDEMFSDDYKWDIVKRKMALIAQTKLTHFATLFEHWDSYDDLIAVYGGDLEAPEEQLKYWRDDEWFGAQRLASCNPTLISLCTAIPQNFGVTAAIVEPFLEGLSLQKAIDSKRLFLVDLKILDGLQHRAETEVCAPLALFFQKENQRLVPVAIQLRQEVRHNNPVFLPSDPPGTWLYAKMWYNNADASYHQSLTHLGFTHLLIEGISVATNRQLSPSHPIFKLLAPHFLYLIAIDWRGLNMLISENGWVEKTMSVGRAGMFELIARGIQEWRLDVHGTLPKYLESRGLLDTTVLSNYHYREDALPLYYSIKKYVSQIINHFYDNRKKLTEDYELQNWRHELETEREKGGVGIQGIPGSVTFENNDELILTCTSIIFTCSVSHAASNFPQYTDYAFPPNYPAYIKGQPPTDKVPMSEEDIVKTLPTKSHTLDIMVVTKLLSDKGTNSLGDFDIQYLHDPVSVKAAQTLRQELSELSEKIKERNKSRFPSYLYLQPDHVPNSISI